MPSLLALATAVPPYHLPQEYIAQNVVEILSLKEEEAQKVKKMYANSAIQKRHSVIPDFINDPSQRVLLDKDYPKKIPGMSARNELYKVEALKLASQVASQAIDAWGREAKEITHVIFISCTGVIAPGIEFQLIDRLKLSYNVQRLGINFMGCFGAFKGLAVAHAFAKLNPVHRILVVSVELCSLHFQHSMDMDTLTGGCLFADGAAAAIIGEAPLPEETPLWNIISHHSLGLDNSLGKMLWEASDHGFLMKLSHQVPVLLRKNIRKFTDQILSSANLTATDCDWALHPGGKSIIQAIEQEMQLATSQTQASWSVLRDYGNMSSATFLFVLESLYHLHTDKKWTLGIGFGPGLSFEAVLLQKCRGK